MSARLIVSLPLYLSVPVMWFVRWLEVDKTSVVDILATRKHYLTSAMNNMVTDALTRDNWDRLVVYEADVLPPRDALVRISQYPDSLDIVGSMCFQHPVPH